MPSWRASLRCSPDKILFSWTFDSAVPGHSTSNSSWASGSIFQGPSKHVLASKVVLSFPVLLATTSRIRNPSSSIVVFLLLFFSADKCTTQSPLRYCGTRVILLCKIFCHRKERSVVPGQRCVRQLGRLAATSTQPMQLRPHRNHVEVMLKGALIHVNRSYYSTHVTFLHSKFSSLRFTSYLISFVAKLCVRHGAPNLT